MMQPQSYEHQPQSYEHQPQSYEHQPQVYEHQLQMYEHQPQDTFITEPSIETTPTETTEAPTTPPTTTSPPTLPPMITTGLPSSALHAFSQHLGLPPHSMIVMMMPGHMHEEIHEQPLNHMRTHHQELLLNRLPLISAQKEPKKPTIPEDNVRVISKFPAKSAITKGWTPGDQIKCH